MATCTFCGESTRNYIGYSVDGTFCSEEHRVYEEMRLGKGIRSLTADENKCRSGQANAGYIWQPRAFSDSGKIAVASGTTCAYCGTAPHGSIEWFENRVYCSHKHRVYDEQKRNGDAATGGHSARDQSEKNCASGASHAGYTWRP